MVMKKPERDLLKGLIVKMTNKKCICMAVVLVLLAEGGAVKRCQ
jgi:hypothetical protein